ncbi:MAG: hypothetical protein ACKVQU_32890 [Burkholderiales bacterium]
MSESPMHGATGAPPNSHGAWKSSEPAHRIMWVVWPAFLAAGFAEAVFFTLVDPEELHYFGDTLELSRRAIYTVGFFCFWAIGTLSSAMTLFLARPRGG